MIDCLRLNHTCIPGVNLTWTFDILFDLVG